MGKYTNMLGVSAVTPPPNRMSSAILAQESGNNPNSPMSIDGAIGRGQILPSTFALYKRPGERIDRDADNIAVHNRIIEDLSRRAGGDPARIAVGYFSGPGNIAPPDSLTPWKNNRKDGNGKSTAGYVSDVLGRLPQEAPAAPGKYANMLLGDGRELRQGTPEFMTQPTSNVSPLNDPSRQAGAGTQAIASLPTDMKERAAYFSAQRFPDDPNGIARYGVQDGRLFYQADDGNFYYEEPKLSLSPRELGNYAASSAGPALPIAGSIAGAIGGEALNPLGGGIPAAMVGAAAGDEVRQGLAMSLAGQKEFSPMQTGMEAGMAGIGQGLGVGAVKFGNRAAARDIAKALTPEAQARIDYLESAAKEFGLTLTPGEKTGLPSLIDQQNVLGSMPASGDILTENLYKPRNAEQIPQAVDRFTSKLSPVESSEVGAQNLQQGAKDTIRFAEKTRSDAASPLYKEVFPKKISTSHFLNIRNTNRLVRNAINGAEKDDVVLFYIEKYQRETGKEISKNSVGFLDAVKQSLDGKAEAAFASGNKKAGNAYAESAKQLREKIDSIVPGYEKARAAYAGESPAVTELAKGEVGLAAKKSPTQLATIPRTMFETGPMAVKRNRNAYIKAGKEQEWKDGLRAYLTEKFDVAAKEYKSGNANPGGGFRASVFGSSKQKQAMQAAMDPQDFATFSRLMDVLEATGRVPQGGSRTAFAGEAIQEMKKQSGGLIGKALRAGNPSNLLDTARIAKAYEQMRLGQHSEKLAEIITSPDAMQKLKALKALPPNSVKARVIVSQILTQYGVAAASEPGDAAPGSLSDTTANPKKGQ